MSPPEHDEQGFEHNMCLVCWSERHPYWTPTRLLELRTQPCCYCGRPNADGIWVRQQPELVSHPRL